MNKYSKYLNSEEWEFVPYPETFKNGGSINNYKSYNQGGMASVEVEGGGGNSEGEHILLPNGFSQAVTGETHSNGGVKMNLPSESMIFSEKLKEPETKKSYAKLAKLFETKKDFDKLDSKFADSIQKSTAQMNIKFKQQKLESLFQKQQEDKIAGFHGAKPQLETIQEMQPMAKYGMKLQKAENGFTGVNPLIDIKSLRLSNSSKKRRDEFLPFNLQNTPDVYGNLAYRESVFKDFEDRTGIKLNRANSDDRNLESIRNFQNQITPELTRDYKLNFTRGNQDLYNEFVKQKGYKKSKDEIVESNNFYDWAMNNKKINQDYADKGKWGHEYYNTAPLNFDTEEEYSKWKQDPDWEQVGNRFVDRSADPNGVITYYDINKKWEKPIIDAKKETKSDVANKLVYSKQTTVNKNNNFIPNLTFGIPLPYNEKTVPLNYYKTAPEFIDPRYLNVQPQLNDVTRGLNTFQSNLGDRGTTSLGNSLQAQANAYNQQEQIYGNKYNYDKGQDSQAQQFNAQAKMTTDQQNEQNWYNQLEDPIRARNSAHIKQYKENQARGLENWNEQMAFNNNSNYINETFNPGTASEFNWGAALKDPDVQKIIAKKYGKNGDLESTTEKTQADGGKVRIKPKFKKK